MLGDLKKILNDRRSKKQAIEEEVSIDNANYRSLISEMLNVVFTLFQYIKKWLAQMISALAYIHKQKIIHRYLFKMINCVLLQTFYKCSAAINLQMKPFL